MNENRPRSFTALVALVAASAALVLGYLGMRGEAEWVGLAVVVTLAVVLEYSYVNVNADFKATLSVVAVFAAMAYGGMWFAVAAGLATGVVSGFTAVSDRLVKGVFNTSMSVVESASGAWVFATLAGVSPFPADPAAALAEPGRMTLGLLGAGLVVILINTTLLTTALVSLRAVPFVGTMREMLRSIVALQFVYVGLAAIAYTLLVRTGPVSILLLVVPLLVARSSLQSVHERQQAYDRMVRAFVKAIELKDGYTRGHAERVSDLSVLVAERMGLSYEERQLIRYGAILHDVGKIGVSLGILCKAGPLDDDEFAEMKTHPAVGAEMLKDIDFLRPALAIVHHHHERMDGRGYPGGLKGDEIPLLTRVVTAVDAFDAMTSTRSYRRALPVHVALEELQANAGTQFDADVVGHLVSLVREQGWEVTDEPVQVAHAPHLNTPVTAS